MTGAIRRQSAHGRTVTPPPCASASTQPQTRDWRGLNTSHTLITGICEPQRRDCLLAVDEPQFAVTSAFFRNIPRHIGGWACYRRWRGDRGEPLPLAGPSRGSGGTLAGDTLRVPRRRHCRRCFARHRSGVPVGNLGRYAATRGLASGAAPSPACGKRHPSGEKFGEFFALQRTVKTGPRTFRCTAR